MAPASHLNFFLFLDIGANLTGEWFIAVMPWCMHDVFRSGVPYSHNFVFRSNVPRHLSWETGTPRSKFAFLVH